MLLKWKTIPVFESDKIVVENHLDLGIAWDDDNHNCNTYLLLSSIPGFDAFQNSFLCLNSGCDSVMTILEKAGGTMLISTTNVEIWYLYCFGFEGGGKRSRESENMHHERL